MLNNIFIINKISGDELVIALAGNPNVGKSTVFNNLTGLKQHTGNWPGKTVVNAQGRCKHRDKEIIFVDLPGTYSLMANSPEEEVARDFLHFGKPDVTIVVMDATCLERNLNFLLQTLAITDNVVVCVNLMDEAKRKKIFIDLQELSRQLGVPVIGTSARKNKGLKELMDTAYLLGTKKLLIEPIKIEENAIIENTTWEKAEKIAKAVTTYNNPLYNEKDRKIDKIITSKTFGIPIMLAILGLILWITIIGANYPSEIIAKFLFWIEGLLLNLFESLNISNWITQITIFGIYRTLAWVVAVMLPPMAIFFPLFTFLEDLGYLPRVAFNLDYFFKKACAHGKQALTMCMGFGCNCAGVIGCRIIESPRERLIAILTNNFVPCNGRFPTLIAIATIFIGGVVSGAWKSILSTIAVVGIILIGIFMTLIISKILSKTILKGIPTSFTLELPPYRKPQIGKIIVRSLLDRTLFVLGRAVAVAAPAGLVIWLMANIQVNGLSLLNYGANFLEPFANLIGLDGYILMAFILGLPANEIVIPIIIMSYMSTGSLMELSNLNDLGNLLISNGWTWLTALCMMIFTLLHYPCGTALWTIRKETQSFKWTIISFLLPTISGILICFTITQVVRLLGLA